MLFMVIFHSVVFYNSKTLERFVKMKLVKSASLMAVLLVGMLLTASCGTPFPLGCLYTQVTLPVSVGGGEIVYNRMGTSQCYSILGWVAGGNASIDEAAMNGDISHVTWASQKVINVLGIYGRYQTVVYGFGEAPDPSVRAAASVKRVEEEAGTETQAAQ